MERLERWRDIPGSELYMVSDLGNVYSKWQGKVLDKKPHKTNKRRVLQWTENGEKFAFPIYVLVAKAFLKEWKPGCSIHHKNSIPYDDRLDNLKIYPNEKEHQRAEHFKLCGDKLRNLTPEQRALHHENISKIKSWQKNEFVNYFNKLKASGFKMSLIKRILGAHYGVSTRSLEKNYFKK